MFRVMIVDDNPNVIEELKEIVDWEDFSSEIVFTCGSGEILLQTAIQEQPDIVLSDISMPGMSGLELAAQLRTISPHTKVVLISCFSDFEFAQKAIELGIVGYIVKPIQKENLVQTMKRVVEIIAEEHFAKAALKHRDKVLSIAQQSIWMNLLMAGGKDDNIEEQLSLLHLQVPKHPKIRVARILLLDQQSQEEMDYQIQRVALLLEQALTSRKDTWMVRPDKVSLILLHITEQGQEASINDLMTKLCIEAETQAKQRIKIGVSNTADQYSALPTLYSQAFHASRRNCGQYLAVTPYEEVVTWTNTENNGEPKEERSGITFYSGSEKQNSKVESRYKETEEQIKRYVETHYMEPITTADVAKAVFLSPSYANTVFRKSCGMTIFDYILVCRINNAKDLLQNTSFPVSKIAELIGYNSKANFYLAFKRLTDMSPTEYRNCAWEGDADTFEPNFELR